MLLLRDNATIDIALRGIAGLLLATGIALLAYRWRALTLSGAIAAIIIGTLAFAFGGILVAAAMVIFFAGGSVIGRVREVSVKSVQKLSTKSARRDATQVFANGAVAVACAVAGATAAAHSPEQASRWMTAAVCALAAASGDTWSTEIGAFSRSAPRLIISGRQVAAGTSGGITLLGTVAALFGGSFVALAGAARPDMLALPAWLVIGACVGLAGSIFDSILGATVQGMWRCRGCNQTSEMPIHGCGRDASLVRGLPWLDNDVVNGIATMGGAALGYLLAVRSL